MLWWDSQSKAAGEKCPALDVCGILIADQSKLLLLKTMFPECLRPLAGQRHMQRLIRYGSCHQRECPVGQAQAHGGDSPDW